MVPFEDSILTLLKQFSLIMTKETNHNKNKVSKEHIDEAFKETASMEELIQIYWDKYSRRIILVLVLITFCFAGYKGVKYYKQQQLEILQHQYQDAKKEGKELALAEENPREPLSGAVFVENADAFYTAGKYDEAIKYYRMALKPLAKTIVVDRVRLGIGISMIMSGDKEGGMKELDLLVNDRKVQGIFRAEAAYQAAILSLKNENYTKANEYLGSLSHIANAGIWAQKGEMLKDGTPELGEK